MLLRASGGLERRPMLCLFTASLRCQSTPSTAKAASLTVPAPSSLWLQQALGLGVLRRGGREATALRQWAASALQRAPKVLSSKDAPKGFGGFFRDKPKGAKSEPPSEKPTPPPSSSSSESSSKSGGASKSEPSVKGFKFEFSIPKQGGGSGGSDGEGSPPAWVGYLALGSLGLLGYYAIQRAGQHEITWKEFISDYLRQTARLEVVNKKWVRVILNDSYDSSSVSPFYFPIPVAGEDGDEIAEKSVLHDRLRGEL